MTGLKTVWIGTRPFRPILVILILLLLGFSIALPGFATGVNLQNILTSVSVVWIVSMGMTFVLISGGLDLSVAAIASLSAILMAKLLEAHVPDVLTLLLAVAFGFVLGGVVNGLLVGYLRLSVFVVTLASLTALTGAINLWTNTQSFYLTASLPTAIATDKWLGVQIPIWIMVAVFLLGLYLQRRTYYGRNVYAIGGSVQAARLSGVRTGATLTGVYAIVGACAGLGGVVAASRAGAATPQIDTNLALLSIAAVLLGGTSLTGGYGGVWGTAVGVLFLGTLQNGLSLAGISSFWQQVVTGVILVAAVLLDRVQGRSWARRGSRRTRSPQERVIESVPAPDTRVDPASGRRRPSERPMNGDQRPPARNHRSWTSLLPENDADGQQPK